jgi:polar amino acid transport system ATP-binding protein/sulfate transport system ATP-binding protein
MSKIEYTKNETILKAENISLNLGGFQILKDVNVEVKNIVRPGVTQGQVVGFLGPSGIGKTKFFEILSGILRPTTGTVNIGSPLSPAEPGRVGVVQQTYPLFPYRTVYGNLLVAARKAKTPKNQCKEKIMNILTTFGLDKHKNRYPAELSGGQRQRVSIAQQLLCSEHFLLLDEPFSGLDMNSIEKVVDMLRGVSLMHELNTIIIVSHDIASTASISDTLWIMGRDRDKDGNIINGAKIKKEFDLMEMDLAWRKGIETEPRFNDLMREIRAIFPTL